MERLIKGLQQRLTGSLQKTSTEIARIQAAINAEDAAFNDAKLRVERVKTKQVNVTTTYWDEAIHDCWDQQERTAYRAIYETAEQEANLRQSAKQQADAATQTAKKEIAEIEKRFLRAKDAPLNRLKTYRAESKLALEELLRVESTARGALTQRGLNVPAERSAAASTQQAGAALSNPKPANSEAALTDCKRAIHQAGDHCTRLTNHVLAKFFDSIWWWLACGLIFVVVIALSLTVGALPPIPSVLTGASVTVLVLLLGFIGVRPWLKRAASAEYPRIAELVEQGKRLLKLGEQLAVAENDEELIRLAKIRDERFEQTKQKRDERTAEIANTTHQAIKQLHEQAANQKLRSSQDLTSGLQAIDSQFQGRLTDEAHQLEEELVRLAEVKHQRQAELSAEIDSLNEIRSRRLEAALKRAKQSIAANTRWCSQHFPAWNELCNAKNDWPVTLDEPLLPVGGVNLGNYLPTTGVLGNEEKAVRGLQVTAPMLFSPLEDEYLVINGDPNASAVKHLVRNLMMRALTSLPAGQVHVCVIDPPGLGRDFGWLMHLGDFDPELVSHRVWTQPGHIAKQLNALAMAAENFIQQSLRNEYASIVEYNRAAGALAEPYRVLLWNSFPHGLDDQSWKSVESLLDAGTRCGIIPVFVTDPLASWPMPEQREHISRRGMQLTLAPDKKSFQVASDRLEQVLIELEPAAADAQSQQVMQEVGRRALLANRVEVPLKQLLPAPEERWLGDSTTCLEIPIGQSGVGRNHSLTLGIGTAQHAIIAGKTGSGKSSLLHAMITSAVLKYSPEQLRLVLLDFKKGVEFQVYAELEIPHADIIGIESHREFGLSALQYLDGCMQHRGERFRQAGVQDLASWNALHPGQPIPRVLVVIDEFQELFVEDDKLAGQAGLLLDRIVRQGRSFGVHAVLSSQTLSGAYSLPRTTLGQMAVRIALQCDASDAQVIFSEDNPGASRLKHPGQAVYNDAGGRIEGNQPMQIGWLTKQEQLQWFADTKRGYSNNDPTTNQLGQTIVYDGNRAAKWNADQVELAIEQSKQEWNPDATWCVVGESVAIRPAITFPVTRQAGRNVLIVGSSDVQAASVLHAINVSLVRDARQRGQQASLFAVQGAKPTDARALALPGMWAKLDCTLQNADIRGTDGVLEEVYGRVRERIDAEDSGQQFAPIILNLIQVGRLRSLKKDDDFGMGAFGDETPSPEKQLEEILRDGPSVGVHTVIWAENYTTVNRWFSRNVLRELEIRLLMHMSASDSTNLVDSIEASKIGDHLMLLVDEATGIEQRFRPFDFDSLREDSTATS